MSDFDDLPPEMPAPPEMPPADTPDGEDDQRAFWMRQSAPYGRFKNGKPRKSPPGGKAKSRAKRAASPGVPSYAEGLYGYAQVGAFALATAGQRNPVFEKDADVLIRHAPNICQALGDLAEQRPEFARILDKILAGGPYSALISAMVPLVVEVGNNHKLWAIGMADDPENADGHKDGLTREEVNPDFVPETEYVPAG